ncbi:MAG: 1-deoxy-D-xylulose-5-phosphate reductoisomerase, partial [Clostridia bacterium]|nr:1-deoxy-D-xylulose-5-phosphate reductoisomerase [Clostridia bacterium]
YPKRLPAQGGALDLTQKTLSFDLPDTDTFRCLPLAIQAGKIGGTMPAVLNGANEAAVALFLKGHIRFLEIPDLVMGAMDAHKTIKTPTLSDIFEADHWAREYVSQKTHTLQ